MTGGNWVGILIGAGLGAWGVTHNNRVLLFLGGVLLGVYGVAPFMPASIAPVTGQ